MGSPVPWLLVLIGAVVALDVPPDELGERIVLRLLDEDLSLVPARAPAPVALQVAVRGHWLEVEARGRREVVQQIEAEPRAVAELEVLQRALIVLERAGVLPAEVGPRATPTPQVHLASWPDLSPGLRGRLGHAVLGAGFGVSRSSGAVRLCAVVPRAGARSGAAPSDAEALAASVLEVRAGAGAGCGDGPAVRLDARRPWAEALRVLLEAAARTTADAAASASGTSSVAASGAARSGGPALLGNRDLAERDPPAGPAARPSAGVVRAAGVEGARSPEAATASSSTAAAPLRLGFTAGAGAWIRSGGVDPAITVGAQLGTGALGGRFDVVVLPATRGTVGVTEVLVLGGPRLAWELGARWSLAASVRAGGLLHAYDVESSTSGLHVDFTADVVVEAALRLGDHLGLRIAAGPGFASREREHLLGAQILWSRGPLRLGLTVGLEVLP